MMYGTHRFDDRVTQLTLPCPDGVSRPWGFPPNVFVLHGAAPALVGTGLPGTEDALRDALDEIGLTPERVARVVLPSARPEALGNVGMFPRAAVFATPPSAAPRSANAALAARVRQAADGLIERGGNDAWTSDVLRAFEASYLAPLPDRLDIVPLRDGQRLRLGTLTLEVMATPGVDPGTLALYEPERRWLFCGPTISLAEEPVPDVAAPYMESLRRISQLEPAAVFPTHGGIERDHRAVFRSAGLATNNLLTNMPFAVPEPLPLPEICRRDLGYFPADLMRFTGTILRYQAMLDELVRTGVAQRDGEGVWAPYRMDRPSRMA